VPARHPVVLIADDLLPKTPPASLYSARAPPLLPAAAAAAASPACAACDAALGYVLSPARGRCDVLPGFGVSVDLAFVESAATDGAEKLIEKYKIDFPRGGGGGNGGDAHTAKLALIDRSPNHSSLAHALTS